MKLMILGHARHGKDTFADLLCEFATADIQAKSSSYMAAEIFLFEKLQGVFGYQSIQECWKDRTSSVRMREIWYDAIKEFNTPDSTRLMREIFKSQDIYVGIRDRTEFLTGRGQELFDLSIWVDAAERKPLEDKRSMTVRKTDADILVDNNGTEEDLSRRTHALVKALGL